MAKSKMAVVVATPETADHDEISARAYQMWTERGCPLGSPEVDWFRAEEELKKRKERLVDHARKENGKMRPSGLPMSRSEGEQVLQPVL